MTSLATTALPALDEGGQGVVILRSDRWEVGVLPGTGGCVTFGRVLLDGAWVDLLRPTRPTALHQPELCSSFPLIPWSNRIRDGVLPFDGRAWQLARNGHDGTAMHGATTVLPWRVVSHDAGVGAAGGGTGGWAAGVDGGGAGDGARIELELVSRDYAGVNFPWHFVARLGYEVRGNRLVVTTSVMNDDDVPFPAGFGHHPYFERVLADPRAGGRTPSDPVLQVPARRGYLLEKGMAIGPAGIVPPRADYRLPRALGTSFVDDCLTNLVPGAPVRITYPDAGLEVRMHLDPVYDHVVVYVPRGRSYFAVEPVTHVNAGFALHDAGVTGTGVFVLEPGEGRSGSFTLEVGALG